MCEGIRLTCQQMCVVLRNPSEGSLALKWQQLVNEGEVGRAAYKPGSRATRTAADNTGFVDPPRILYAPIAERDVLARNRRRGALPSFIQSSEACTIPFSVPAPLIGGDAAQTSESESANGIAVTG
jgi:hypothetical protein